MFDVIDEAPEDALHAVMGRYNADRRLSKIDLGVGVYREANGQSPIMACVQRAQQRLQDEESSKSYLALKGDERFLAEMQRLVFAGDVSDRLAAIQSVGGTGAVRLGIELARNAKPDLKVHVGVPTWPNHLGICEQLKVHCVTWPHLVDINNQGDAATTLAAEQALAALSKAQPGDLIILHGPCHNPTGIDIGPEEMLQIVEQAGARGVVPLIDAAYYGLGAELDADLELLAACVARAPELLLVMSCSKSFGLYRERTGVLFAACKNSTDARKVQGRLEFLARGNYSMPPSHGAAVAGIVLADSELCALWRAELAAMRTRISHLRSELHSAGSELAALAAVGTQRGIFSLLPLAPDQVHLLAEDHGIYLPRSGRINIAGFKTGDIARFKAALSGLSALSPPSAFPALPAESG